MGALSFNDFGLNSFTKRPGGRFIFIWLAKVGKFSELLSQKHQFFQQACFVDGNHANRFAYQSSGKV